MESARAPATYLSSEATLLRDYFVPLRIMDLPFVHVAVLWLATKRKYELSQEWYGLILIKMETFQKIKTDTTWYQNKNPPNQMSEFNKNIL